MQFRELVSNLKNYELVCKRRSSHAPLLEDKEDFIHNAKFPKETYCKDCGVALELKLDEDDPNMYWVREI